MTKPSAVWFLALTTFSVWEALYVAHASSQAFILLLLEKKVHNNVLREDYQFIVLAAYLAFKTNIKHQKPCWIVSNF